MSDNDVISVTVPAALSPADAPGMRDEVVEKLSAALASGGNLTIEIDGEQPNPCSLQILVGARRSADQKDANITYTGTGSEAFSSVEIN
ncbi:MAG: hypothetical protein AAFN27_15705 [Pseudomonadota bacterium]